MQPSESVRQIWLGYWKVEKERDAPDVEVEEVV